MKTKKRILFMLIVQFVSIHLFMEGSIKFEHITQKQGLSQRIVYSIIQDKYGFLWFGTRNGLNRYDGYRFVIYKHKKNNPNSLSNNTIRSICSDRLGNLWIGTWGGGLNVFDIDKERFSHYIHNPKDKNSLLDNFIYKVFSDSMNRIWILTRKGLQRFNFENKTFAYIGHNPSDPKSLSSDKVYSIFEDASNMIWIGTSNGLNQLIDESDAFNHFWINTKNPNDLKKNSIRSIFEDNRKRLWIGTENGRIYFFLRNEKIFKPLNVKGKTISDHLNLDVINCFQKDQFNNIWIGTFFRGLVQYDLKNERVTHYKYDPFNLFSINDNRIKSIYLDRSGSLWIGTDSGINKFSPYKTKFNLYKNNPRKSGSLIDNRVRSIYEDSNGTLWIGMEKGLVQYDRNRKRVIRYKPEILNQKKKGNYIVNTIIEDISGNLWLGTNSGLIEFKRKNGQFILYQNKPGNPDGLVDNHVWAIHEYNKDILLIGTKGGLDKLNKKTGKFTHYVHDPTDVNTLCCNFVHIIFKDSTGLLWIGTDEGIDQFNIEKNYFKHYQHDPHNPYSLSNDNVWSIYEDINTNLWFGTLEGLNQYDRKNDNFHIVHSESDFSHRAIHGILGDEAGNLWISTDNGLFRFCPQTGNILEYDINDGLQDNEFGLGCCFKSKKGEMFFGGDNGFNSFFPQQVTGNPYIPPIVITSFEIFGKPVEVNNKSVLKKNISATRSIEISHKENFLSFEFAALDFTTPSKNQYSFILEGFDKEWHSGDTENHATYTNLPHGNYVFRVKGSNNDKRWNKEGITLKIRILPPFWQTWWFKTFVLLILIVLMLILYFIRIKIVKEKIILKEKISQLILSQKMKLVGLLAAGATHDLSNLLFTIVSYSKKIASSQIEDEEAIKIERVKNAAEKAVQIVKQILAFSRPSNARNVSHDLSLLIDEIIEILKAMIPHNINVQWKSQKNCFLMVIDPLKFQQVMINLIFNSIEAMPDGGDLKISIHKENNRNICIEIEDTGNGIEDAVIKRMFMPYFTTKTKERGSGLGLFVVKQIVEEYNGKIKVESNLKKGTIFRIFLPNNRLIK